MENSTQTHQDDKTVLPQQHVGDDQVSVDNDASSNTDSFHSLNADNQLHAAEKASVAAAAEMRLEAAPFEPSANLQPETTPNSEPIATAEENSFRDRLNRQILVMKAQHQYI